MASDTSAQEKAPEPDFSGFKRRLDLASGGIPGVGGPDLVSLSTGSFGKLGPLTPPQDIPWHVIDMMGFHPHIALAEEIWRALLSNVELYRVVHDDPAIQAETKAWLEPIIEDLLRAVSLAFAYGVVPYVLDWDSDTLSFTVNRDGKDPFTKNLKDHAHYVDVHELWPGNVTLKTKADRLVHMEYMDQKYLPNRAFVSVWGRTFGRWLGQGSRRKAYKAFFQQDHVHLWRGRFLERNVDPPRKAYAPAGTIKIDGEDHSAAELMLDSIMGLKGAGVAVIPSSLLGDSSSTRAFDVEAMDLKADKSAEIFNTAINLTNVDMFIASLVPPTAAGAADTTFASGRVHGELLEDLLNAASNWVAKQLSAPVEVVHRTRYADRDGNLRHPLPKVKARQFPKTKAKRFMELLTKILDTQRTIKGEIEGGEGGEAAERIYTIAEMIDDKKILDELGVAYREPSEVAREKPPEPVMGEPGRDKEADSARQERRDNAREPEGEDATGQEDEGIDGNERK